MPVCVVNYNVHVLPGVPSIFQSLLEGLRKVLLREGRVGGEGITRVLVSTPMLESEMATFLEQLQEKVKERGVKVGSYPR